MNSENIVGRMIDETELFRRKNTYEVVWFAFATIAVALLYVNIFLGVFSLLLCTSLIIWELKSPVRRAIRIFNKAGFEIECGKYEDAVAFIEQALDLSPDNKTYNSAAAYIKYVHLKDYESAKENLHCCIMRNPYPEYKYVLADCHFHTGFFAKAIQLLDFIALGDLDYSRKLLMAKCYLKKGNLGMGISILEKLIQDDDLSEPAMIEARYWLGFAYFNKDDFRSARENLAVVYTNDESYLDTEVILKKINTPMTG